MACGQWRFCRAEHPLSMFNAQAIPLFLLFGLGFLLLSACYSKEVFPTIEVFFQYQANALRIQAVACKVAVVGLVVHFDGQVAAWE